MWMVKNVDFHRVTKQKFLWTCSLLDQKQFTISTAVETSIFGSILSIKKLLYFKKCIYADSLRPPLNFVASRGSTLTKIVLKLSNLSPCIYEFPPKIKKDSNYATDNIIFILLLFWIYG